jgi:hypothetical protein
MFEEFAELRAQVDELVRVVKVRAREDLRRLLWWRR